MVGDADGVTGVPVAVGGVYTYSAVLLQDTVVLLKSSAQDSL